MYLMIIFVFDDMKGVRGAASFALGQFAEHLQPEISEHYERVLPCIFTVLSDAVPDVQVSMLLMLNFFPETNVLDLLELLLKNTT